MLWFKRTEKLEDIVSFISEIREYVESAQEDKWEKRYGDCICDRVFVEFSGTVKEASTDHVDGGVCLVVRPACADIDEISVYGIGRDALNDLLKGQEVVIRAHPRWRPPRYLYVDGGEIIG